MTEKPLSGPIKTPLSEKILTALPFALIALVLCVGIPDLGSVVWSILESMIVSLWDQLPPLNRATGALILAELGPFEFHVTINVMAYFIIWLLTGFVSALIIDGIGKPNHVIGWKEIGYYSIVSFLGFLVAIFCLSILTIGIGDKAAEWNDNQHPWLGYPPDTRYGDWRDHRGYPDRYAKPYEPYVHKPYKTYQRTSWEKLEKMVEEAKDSEKRVN